MELRRVEDEKRRPEIDRDNMEQYKFAGIEIEELLTNGLQLYIPYDIHNLMLEAIQYSLKKLEKDQEYYKNNLDFWNERLTKGELNKNSGVKNAKNFSENRLKEIEKYIKIFKAMIDINQR